MPGDAEEGKPSYESTLNHGNGHGMVETKGGPKGKEDPFGDESNSQVKYKTLRWWYGFQ